MSFSIYNRRLLSGMVAGSVALAAASACSRSDRTNGGRDSAQTGAVAPADSQASASASAPAQPNTAAQPSTGTQPSSGDTATGTPSTGTGNTSTPTPKAGHRRWRPRSSATQSPSANAPSANADQGVAGYKPMGQDSSTTSGNVTDSAQASPSVVSVPDTAANTNTAATEMGSPGSADTMARDTSAALAHGDTTAQAEVGASSQAQADTATLGDTAVILTHADTSQQTGVATGNVADTTAAVDTTAMASDSTSGQVAERMHPDTVSKKADELAKHESARVRPPEDSTGAAAVGAAGVASTGNIATGADAVALMERQGERCVVTSPDQNRDELWDMASSPSTLNPCGTGTMTLPRIWTGEKK